jgi:protoporphyrinogen/coproporphyrinogen III oxidase
MRAKRRGAGGSMPSAPDPGGPVELAVVGGGVAGLFAAWRAKRAARTSARGGAGTTVRLLEAAQRPGGVVATIEESGFRFERAASTIRGAALELSEAIRELGLGGELVAASPLAKRRWIARRGRLALAPGGPLSFAFSPLLTVGAKLRLLREPWIAEPAAREDETLASFVARRFGEGFADPLFDAVVTGIFAGDFTRLEAASAMARMTELSAAHGSVIRGFIAATRENKRKGLVTHGLFALRGGMESLVARLARELGDALVCGFDVVSIARRVDGWELRDAAGRVQRARELILATPSWVSAKLLAPVAPAVAQELAAIETANVAVVAIGVERKQVGGDVDGLGFLVPGSERSPLLGILYESSLFPDRAPPGHALLRCMVGGERLKLDDDLAAIGDLAWREASRYLALTGAPVMRRVILHKPGIPQYRPGHARRLARIDAALASDRNLAGLKLAGWCYRGIALNDRAREAAH